MTRVRIISAGRGTTAVTPAKAGAYARIARVLENHAKAQICARLRVWVPAFAGVTGVAL